MCGFESHQRYVTQRPQHHPYRTAEHLRAIAQRIIDEAEAEQEGSSLLGYYTVGCRAYIWAAEADALERGYRLGRIMAAFEVRTGLDKNTGNGSIRWDSDTEPPPTWLMDTVEKLARGDA